MEPHGATTRGACTCGLWQRDVDAQVVAVTGRSREEALRAGHELHTRGLDTPAPAPVDA
ncbi:MAG TPA: hypothetical protein VM370_12495 [Candidatus Thermoplasmatota archaeon]|nr:hypothetical protein [Candidatus Thermoplasmatota archaeon]